MTRRRRVMAGAVLVVALWSATGGVTMACGGLVAANGAVRLVRTSTLAAYHDGVEHYVTSFQFASGQESFGSIVPLPGVPSAVERGGDWTLQRLQQEVAPPAPAALAADRASAEAGATVLLETEIDALDITILEGGGGDVVAWASENGFALDDDAPEALDFYADRSPVFMAARFDAGRAAAQGLGEGDGTPIHLTIPTDNPWVPLRILALGKPDEEVVEADVFLLTDDRPDLYTGEGVRTERSEEASTRLLDDLRSDTGMEWIPSTAWLSYLRVDAPAGELTYDLAVDTHGGNALALDAGFSSRQQLASFEGPLATIPNRVGEGVFDRVGWGLGVAGLLVALAASWGAGRRNAGRYRPEPGT